MLVCHSLTLSNGKVYMCRHTHAHTCIYTHMHRHIHAVTCVHIHRLGGACMNILHKGLTILRRKDKCKTKIISTFKW